ncbi:ABC transporter substrate-binding protein [Mesorhizobium sp. KR9-304]|uniref:ABC transporter substrate-binding protein n=1 Tax=Mesorhizobium sp. KR9-304 TaxID=3156614 RepID=UPI0032B32082
MKDKRLGLVRAGRGLAAALVMLSVFVPITDAPAQSGEKTVVMGIEGDPLSLDPHTHALWLTARVVSNIFEGFVGQDLSKSNVPIAPIVPALAESWDISADGAVYTFKLRQNVKFHDGESWNAEAAKFNFDRILNRESPQFYEKAYQQNTWWRQDVEKYEVVDDYTFRITLKTPNAEFLRRLSQGGIGSAWMASPKAVRAAASNDDFAKTPVGTGPFRFVERVFGEQIVLEKNENYWDPARVPQYDRLIYRPIVDVAAREQALVTGAIDIAATPSPDNSALLEQQGFTLVKGEVPTVYVIWLNMKQKALQDVRVRRAISMALDREGLSQKLRLGQAIPAYSMLNIGGPGYDPDYKCNAYDPAKAKDLLKEAGYGDGFDVKMIWTPGGAGDVGMVADAEWFQRNLADVGIRASIEVLDIGTFFTMMNQGMPEGSDMLQISWGENSANWLDAVVRTSALPPNGYNSGYYDNPKMDQLLDEARTSASEEQMTSKLRALRDVICEDAAFIPTHSPLGVVATSKSIHNFVMAPQHWPDMALVTKE